MLRKATIIVSGLVLTSVAHAQFQDQPLKLELRTESGAKFRYHQQMNAWFTVEGDLNPAAKAALDRLGIKPSNRFEAARDLDVEATEFRPGSSVFKVARIRNQGELPNFLGAFLKIGEVEKKRTPADTLWQRLFNWVLPDVAIDPDAGIVTIPLAKKPVRPGDSWTAPLTSPPPQELTQELSPGGERQELIKFTFDGIENLGSVPAAKVSYVMPLLSQPRIEMKFATWVDLMSGIVLKQEGSGAFQLPKIPGGGNVTAHISTRVVKL